MLKNHCCICGTVKQCGPYLDQILCNIEKIGSIFEKYVIIISFDDDGSAEGGDNSLEILKAYADSHSNMILYINDQPLSPTRTINIATARNRCMDIIVRYFANYEYFIMMDCDDINAVPTENIDLEPIQRNLEVEREDMWDALSFNRSPYYDTWGLSIYPLAFSKLHFHNGDEIWSEHIKYILENTPDDYLIDCYSAFNGFALYRTEKFIYGYGANRAKGGNDGGGSQYCKYDGNVRLDLIPLNMVMENIKKVDIVKELGFSKCRLSLAIPRNENYTGLTYFEGKNIATSYPNLTNQFLLANGVKAQTHEISGSVEIAPSIGLAEGICDIVSTGGTLLSNGLKEVAEVFKSQAVLIAYANLSSAKKAILSKLLFRIDSVQRGQNAKYVVLNAKKENLEQIISLLPGMKSPSVVPLATEGWFSLHSVISENDFWEIIESLREAGAEGILVLPIEKMIL